MRIINDYIPNLRNAIKHDTPFTFDGHTYDVADRGERNQAVQSLLDGGYCDERTLVALTDLLLYEELTDSHPDKMAREEYPCQSETQLARRKCGVHRKNDGGGLLEDAIFHAENKGTDGADYSYPIRRKRNAKENRYIDEVALAKNKERRLRYKSFIRGELDGPFSVNIETGKVIGKVSDIYSV